MSQGFTKGIAISTDGTLSENSDLIVSSQKAIKTYVDSMGGGGGAGISIADATGTVDVITATFSPAITLADKTLCAIIASGANTSTTPTFNPNGLGAKTITKTMRSGAVGQMMDIRRIRLNATIAPIIKTSPCAKLMIPKIP